MRSRFGGNTVARAVFSVALSLLSATAQGRGAPHEWNGVKRVVAVGDVHGAYENFVAVLEGADLVDERLQWIGGKAHLVQTGDVLDRGPDSRKVMDLLMELEVQAEKAGGRVHALIGNHEAMNVAGFLDYVSPREFHSYTDSRSLERREQAFRQNYRRLRQESSETGTKPPPEEVARREFESRIPLGYVEHRIAFSPRGRYGRWILSHNVAVRIDGVVFSHGDWSEAFSAAGIAEVNRRVRTELSGEASLADGFTFHPESPLQYRGISKLPLGSASQAFQRETVDRILANLGARLMVVGHTVTRGVIEARFGGRHISIDTGMLELYDGGRRTALEIEEGRLRALHPKGEVEVPEDLDERTLSRYLAAVAEVDPENRSVREKIAADTPEGGIPP